MLLSICSYSTAAVHRLPSVKNENECDGPADEDIWRNRATNEVRSYGEDAIEPRAEVEKWTSRPVLLGTPLLWHSSHFTK